MNIKPLLDAFAELRGRGVFDPLYCRLVLRKERGFYGILWRDERNADRALRTGETFVLSIPHSEDVSITWVPLFEGKVTGEKHAVHYACWFLSQELSVAGGTYECIDNFEHGPADWSLPATEAYPVRCGSYVFGGKRIWRQPSSDAVDWVRDPQRFQTSENIRRRILQALLMRLKDGQRMTIRRIIDRSLSHP